MTHEDDSSFETADRTFSLRTARIRIVPTINPLADTPIPIARMPARLGLYEVKRELGRGGMGVVYEGYDSKLRRSVALKVLKNLGPSDDDLLKRFQTEAEAVARLQHPNIVQVIEVGLQDGAPFVALEYLSGGSLHQRIGGKPTPPLLAAERVRDLAGATAHAHAHGVLHRDLKPANVLFTADGIPKITDFGAARFDESNFGNDAGLTRAGEVIGTPQYMSPEQANGHSARVGPETDVYSLGAILYELVTGRPPFNGVDPLDVIFAVRTQEPIAPRKLQPSIPRDLETICLKCLEKDSKRRYSTANELQRDLARFLIGDTIRARPAGAIRRTWVRAKRHPAGAGMIVGLIVAGLVGLAAFVWQFQATVAAKDAALNHAAEARTSALDAERARIETELKKAESDFHLVDGKWNLYCSRISQAQLHLEMSDSEEARKVLDDTPHNFRGWEWDLFRGHASNSLWQVHIPKVLPEAGVSWIQKQAINPDGSLIACVVGDPYHNGGREIHENPCSLAIFRVADGSHVFDVIEGTPVRCEMVRWLSDRVFATIDLSGHIRAWDVTTKRRVVDRPSMAPKEKWGNVRFSPDGLFSQVTGDGTVEMIDPLHAKPIGTVTLEHPNELVHSIGPGGKRIILGTYHPELDKGFERVVDVDSGRELYKREFVQQRNSVLSTDGKWLVSTPWDGRTCKIVVRNCDTMAIAWTRTLPVGRFDGYRFSPDGKRLLVVTHGHGEMHAFDVATGEHPTLFRGYDGTLRDTAYSPDGLWLVTAGDDNIVRLWNATTGTLQCQHRGHIRSVRTCSFTPDGRKVITGSADERIICWDLTRTRAAGGLMPALQTGGNGTRLGAIGFTEAGHFAVLNTEVGLTMYDPSTSNPTVHRSFEKLKLRDAKEIRDFAFSTK